MNKLALLIVVLPLLNCAPDEADIVDVQSALPIRGEGGDPTPPRPTTPKVQCYRDADGDGFTSGNSVTLGGTSCPSGWRANPNPDCNDNDASVPRWCTRDLDGDGHGSVGLVATCGACPDIPADDCNDNDKNVMPRDCVDPNDYDGDGWSRTISLCATSCPSTRLLAGDCQPWDGTIHPERREIAGNRIDDNCDGRTDETELTFHADGDQQPTSLFLRYTLNDADTLDWVFKSRQTLYVRAEYAALSDTTKAQYTGWQSANLFSIAGGTAGVFFLDGLMPSTPYRVRLAFARDAQGTPITGSGAPSNDFFGMTLASSSDPVEQIRPLMVNLAVHEWDRSRMGEMYAGTAYCGGCDSTLGVGHNWCSEFYNWVANHWFIPMFMMAGSDQVTVSSIVDAFANHGGTMVRLNVPYYMAHQGRPGDYLPIAGTTHSEMFLAWDQGLGEYWWIAGNVGNRVKIGSKSISADNGGMGVLTPGMIK